MKRVQLVIITALLVLSLVGVAQANGVPGYYIGAGSWYGLDSYYSWIFGNYNPGYW